MIQSCEPYFKFRMEGEKLYASVGDREFGPYHEHEQAMLSRYLLQELLHWYARGKDVSAEKCLLRACVAVDYYGETVRCSHD